MKPIKTIEIKNFKSLRHVTVEDCRRINIFIGYPNVGKSNILEALGLYSVLQLQDENFRFDEICRVKHFSELFFNQDSRHSCVVTINEGVELNLGINSSNELSLTLISLFNQSSIKENQLIFSASIDSREYRFSYSNSPIKSDYSYIVNPVKKYDFSSKAIFNARRPQALAVPEGNNLLDILQTNAELRKEIRELFNIYNLKLFIERTDNSIKFIKELNDGTAVSIPYHQVADTLKRLIFFKAAILTNAKTVLLLEEPEAHMFPPYISKLTGDIMYDKNANQYFISTHSPFVINDFMEHADKEQFSIYAVGYKQGTGETIVKRLSDEQIDEIYQYGVDLFFNLEEYLKDSVA